MKPYKLTVVISTLVGTKSRNCHQSHPRSHHCSVTPRVTPTHLAIAEPTYKVHCNINKFKIN